MLFELKKGNAGFEIGAKMQERNATELGIREKAIEDWIAEYPHVLFHGEELLVIAQSISGHAMADVLALDASGSLVLVEIKRDWSDRKTVGQLLEYAASLRSAGYARLDVQAQRYSRWRGGSLIDQFRVFVDQADFREDEIGKRMRVVIVAPAADQGLSEIVAWLGDYGVPIAFVPFALYSDESGEPRLLSMESAPVRDVSASAGDWAGHWIFNTNETHAPGAWKAMFDRGLAAIYGYPNGPRNLEGAMAGEKVFAYVNRQGLRALGTVKESVVRPGSGIFQDPPGKQAPAEYHLAVDWECILPVDSAVSASEARKLGYNLPVRSVFAKLQQGTRASLLAREVSKRCARDETEAADD